MFKGVKIIIPRGDGRIPLRVARCLGAIPARYVLLAKDPENVARKSRYCSEFIFSDPQSDAELLDQLLQIKKSEFPEIILPITTEGFEFVSRNRDMLSKRFRIPPISNIDDLIVASDKWKLYDFSIQNNIPVLASTPLSQITAEAIENGEFKIEYPALVKSRKREGGSGFRKVESANELTAQYRELKSEQKDFFVQPFVDGKDVSLSAFCENGVIKSYTLWTAVSYGKIKYQIPLCIQFGENERVLETGKRLLKLLNWQGICDIDFFADSNTGEVWLLEINARFWGNVLGCATCGVNFPDLMCQRALSDDAIDWPTQVPGVYCYPKGLPDAIRIRNIRSRILKNPLKTTGINAVLRDLGPEFYKLFLKIKRLINK